MLGSLWAITKNSFRETTRQPVYGILLLTGMAMIALSPTVVGFAMLEDLKLLIDMGLGTIFMLGLVMAVLSATQTVSREIEAKTAGAIISKPVGRFVFVLGKFLGVSLAMTLATFLLIIILLITMRLGVPSMASWTLDWPAFLGEVVPFLIAMGLGLHANYFYRWNFTSTAVTAALPLYVLGFLFVCLVSKEWTIDSGDHLWIANSLLEQHADQVFLGAILVFLGVWVISAVAVAASTRLNVVPNVLVCLGVFFIGMVSHFLFGWTVDYAWIDWVPEKGLETVTISGNVRDAEGMGIAGVGMAGLPAGSVTDKNGYYEAQVALGGYGTVRPKAERYLFSPRERVFGDVTANELQQDYVGFEHYRGLARHAYTAWAGVAWVAYHVVPSFQLFWAADQLERPDPYIPRQYVAMAAVYAVLWCAAMVGFAAFLFERRDII